MTVKDVNGTTIDPVSLPNGTIEYSAPAVYNYGGWHNVNWVVCGVEIVADKLTSDKTRLHLYARVFDFVNSDHSGALNIYPYTWYDNTIYDDRKWSDPYSSNTQVTWNGVKNQIFTTSTDKEWELYFPIDYYSSGTVSSKGAKTGWAPDGYVWSGGIWGSGSTGHVGSPITGQYNIQTTTVKYNRGSADQGNAVTDMRVIGWEGSNWYFTIIDKPSDYSKQNYHFTKWNTKQDGTGTNYLPGALYYGTEPLTLYAQWESDNVTLSYNKNIPSGVTEVGTITVPSSVGPSTPPLTTTVGSALVGEGNLNPPRHFEKWNTKADGSGTDYAPNASITCNVNQVLYAKWSNDYKEPEWDGAVNVYRCDANGASNQSEEYLRITGHVKIYKTRFLTVDNVSPANAPYELTCGPITLSTNDFSVSDEGTYLSVGFDYHTPNQVVSIGQTYSFTVSFIDLYGHQYGYASSTITTQKSIGVAFVTFSTNGYGKSAAFGLQAAAVNDNSRPIPSNGRLDISMDTVFSGNVLGLPVDNSTIQYNANNELEVVGGSVSSLGYTEVTGGEPFSSYTGNTSDWPSGNGYDYSYTPPNQTAQESFGYGWKQRKWADSSSATGGRLEQWVWFWTNYSDNNSTSWWYTYAMPRHMDSSLETFNAKPNFIPNLTGVTPSGSNYRYGFAGVQSINVTNSGASDGLDYTFSSTAHASVNDKYLWQVYFDGYWGV